MVTGSNATETGQALANIAGLSVALAANTTYEVSIILSLKASSAAGIKLGVNFSAAGATIEATSVQGGGTPIIERIALFNTAGSVILATAGAEGGAHIKGIVTVGANAGNLTAQFLKVTSGTATAFIGSYIKRTKVA